MHGEQTLKMLNEKAAKSKTPLPQPVPVPPTKENKDVP